MFLSESVQGGLIRKSSLSKESFCVSMQKKKNCFFNNVYIVYVCVWVCAHMWVGDREREIYTEKAKHAGSVCKFCSN